MGVQTPKILMTPSSSYPSSKHGADHRGACPTCFPARAPWRVPHAWRRGSGDFDSVPMLEGAENCPHLPSDAEGDSDSFLVLEGTEDSPHPPPFRTGRRKLTRMLSARRRRNMLPSTWIPTRPSQGATIAVTYEPFSSGLDRGPCNQTLLPSSKGAERNV